MDLFFYAIRRPHYELPCEASQSHWHRRWRTQFGARPYIQPTHTYYMLLAGDFVFL